MVATTKAPDSDVGAEPGAWRASVRRPGVLVAVREPGGRVELARQLTAGGFDVWTAGTGVDALATYVEHTGAVDVLVLDADLTDLPGMAFLRRLRPLFPGVPCVFLGTAVGTLALDLILAGATVLPRDTSPRDLTHRLWEAVAFGDQTDD